VLAETYAREFVPERFARLAPKSQGLGQGSGFDPVLGEMRLSRWFCIEAEQVASSRSTQTQRARRQSRLQRMSFRTAECGFFPPSIVNG
jgi:hypothetical protein